MVLRRFKFKEVSKALKSIPAGGLTSAVGLIFQQTHVFVGRLNNQNFAE